MHVAVSRSAQYHEAQSDNVRVVVSNLQEEIWDHASEITIKRRSGRNPETSSTTSDDAPKKKKKISPEVLRKRLTTLYKAVYDYTVCVRVYVRGYTGHLQQL